MTRPPIEPTAVYTMAEAAALVQMGKRTLEDDPALARVKTGHRTVRVIGADLLAWLQWHRVAA